MNRHTSSLFFPQTQAYCRNQFDSAINIEDTAVTATIYVPQNAAFLGETVSSSNRLINLNPFFSKASQIAICEDCQRIICL